MACLKELTELVLTHMRLTPQVDVLFDADEIAVSIFVRIEPCGLIGGRALLYTLRADVIGIKQSRYVRPSTLRDLSVYGARFSRSCSPLMSGPIIEALGLRPGALSSAQYPPGYHGIGMFGAQMSASMLAIYVRKYGSLLGHTQKPVRT